ncbi:hypothetical protein BSLG_005745 [Batrachochytrium salamandrivorans]|nr:hypothetical protein BSLG_005745 [Batrachochytrium salamandrivorans]
MLSGNPTDSISLINAHAEKDRFSAIQMHEQQQLHHLRYSPLSDQLNQRPVSQLSQLSFIRQQESEHLSQRHYKASPPGIMDHNTSGAIHDHSDLQDMQHSLGSHLISHTSRYDTTNSIESNALASPSLYGISQELLPISSNVRLPRSSGLSGPYQLPVPHLDESKNRLVRIRLSINTDMPLLFSASPISSPFAPGAVGSPIGDIVYLQQHFEKQHHLQSSLDNALFQPHGLQHMNHTQPQSDLSSSAPLNHSSSNFNDESAIHSDDAQTHSSVGPTTSGSGSSAPKVKNPTLYKTELCRAWEETGSCRYGAKCQFAHSSSELRQLDRHPKYKTEMCKTFWERGSCLCGKRCCFIHLERTAADGAVPTAAALEAAGITVHAGIATAAMGKGHAARNPFVIPTLSTLHRMGLALLLHAPAVRQRTALQLASVNRDTTNSVEDINDRFETMHFSTSATDTTSTTLSSTAAASGHQEASEAVCPPFELMSPPISPN